MTYICESVAVEHQHQLIHRNDPSGRVRWQKYIFILSDSS